MELLHATGNYFKYNLMKQRLSVFSKIELVNPKMLNLKIDVNEDGKTAEENAIKKAKAYYEKTKIPVIAEDAGLYINKFKEDEQPGLFVKRVNGIDGLSDEEILKYYIDKLNEYGGESLAHYYIGLCLIDKDGNCHSTTIDETEFLLTSKKCNKKSLDGAILECISYDIELNKYFDERNEEEEENHYKKLNKKCCELVEKYILKDNN